MITKGMAARPNTLSNFPDLVASSIKEKLGFEVPVAAIAGPCIAGELAVRRNTGTVIVSHDFSLALKLCEALQTDYYHPRASLDMMGVETCAAFKNFFAIAVGWAHGALEKLTPTENKALNNNAAAILFDQAVREMMVLVKTLGGSPESVWGMPGVGDLYVTCQAGRNSRLGQHLGRGLSYTEVKQGPMKQDTIEGAELGIAVSDSIHAMIKTGKIDPRRLPLTLALLQTLTQNTPFNPPWDLLH
jgi:glycerol-3-phosphate dehydrogenase (NAD(P)+)